MQSKYLLFILPSVLMVITSACGTRAPAYQSPPGGGPVATPVETLTPTMEAIPTQAPALQATASVTPAGPALINVGRNDHLGPFLVDDKGMTLYLYKRDTPNASNCNDNCAATWPPLLTNGNTVSAAGADASKVGAITRIDGTMQVTYDGWPLYHYSEDIQPGDTKGLGIGSVWYMISPTGDTLK